MRRVSPLLVLGILAALAATGLTLWRSEGAVIWLQGMVAYCL
jgi:hypothetical protein